VPEVLCAMLNNHDQELLQELCDALEYSMGCNWECQEAGRYGGPASSLNLIPKNELEKIAHALNRAKGRIKTLEEIEQNFLKGPQAHTISMRPPYTTGINPHSKD